MMIPAYRHSSVSSSLMHLDLNEDQNPEFFSPNHHTSSSFSSLSSYNPILFHPPDQDHQQGPYYSCEPKHLPNVEEADQKIIPSSGSWDQYSSAENHDSSSSSKLKLVVRNMKEEINVQAAAEEGGSVKWMSSKMRMMKKMMVSDQKVEDHQKQQPLSPLGTESTDNSSSSNYGNHSNNTVRVCSDCHTTKTPLWRSGPRGPKTLCNACGIRQRKARRAMAAASANGTIVVAAGTSSVKRNNKLQKKKENKSKIECASTATTHIKRKRKLGVGAPKPITQPPQSRNKFGFEDLTLSLSNNLALQQVFPQDEKEAAILLMALSYGLVHG